MSHEHNIQDSDINFVIDPNTRSIVNKTAKTMLMQYDHNSERFTFEMPRYIEGHDMSVCDHAQIHYINTSVGTSASERTENTGIYEIDDLTVSSTDPEKVTGSWLVTQNSTLLNGTLQFMIRFICYGPNNNMSDKFIWNTGIFSAITIAKGLDNSDAVVQFQPDILDQLYNEVVDLRSEAVATNDTEGRFMPVGPDIYEVTPDFGHKSFSLSVETATDSNSPLSTLAEVDVPDGNWDIYAKHTSYMPVPIIFSVNNQQVRNDCTAIFSGDTVRGRSIRDILGKTEYFSNESLRISLEIVNRGDACSVELYCVKHIEGRDGLMTSEDKTKLDSLAEEVGNVSDALDELHAYAQALTGGTN